MKELETPTIDTFVPYPKTPRLFREVVVSEKLDGTNAQIVIEAAPPCLDGQTITDNYFVNADGGFVIRAGSRNKWITPKDDNYGFAKWVSANRAELIKLGVGRHFGEWWGQGIQRNYGLTEKRFSLFNVARWADGAVTVDRYERGTLIQGGVPLSPRPACCGVVPVLYRGTMSTMAISQQVEKLRGQGSRAVPGWMKPEGIIVFHTAANKAFKVLLENDSEAKGE